jgi:Tfp pilus assembly protein PilN
MNFKNMPEIKWMAGRSSLILIFRDSTVDAVWLEQSLLGPSIRLMKRFSRDEQVPELLAQQFRAAEKTPAHVLVCLPRAMVMQRTLFYPAAVQNDLSQMLQFEVSRHVPLPEADRRVAFAAMPLPDGKQIGVNLLAARSTEISAFLEPLTAVGIPVDEVTSLSSLLVPEANSVPTLLILTDDTQVELVLFAKGLLYDSLPVDRQAAGFCQEALVDAARRMAVRHRDLLGAEGIGRIVCAGTAELPEEFRNSLETSFGLHIHSLEIPEVLRPAASSFSAGPVLAEALCAAVAEPPPTLNLIERPSRKVSLSRRTLIVAGLSILLTAELLAGWLIRTVSPAMALKNVEHETADLKRSAAPIQAVKNQNRELRSEIQQLDELGKTRVSVMSMLKVLSDTLPEDTYLQGITYTRGDNIQIKGRSKAPDRIPQLVQNIPFVKTIEESDIGKKDDEYFRFNLSAALRSTRNE